VAGLEEDLQDLLLSCTQAVRVPKGDQEIDVLRQYQIIMMSSLFNIPMSVM
jgi:hypothetical protein